MSRKSLLALAVMLTLWSFSGNLQAQIITTVAGSTGIGDGGPATQATVINPTGVAVDANGNVYIAEQENNRIRKVSPGGIITTVAGTGIPGISGDGGPATSARLNFPRSVAVDAAGNLYFSDANNHRIRRVSTTGTITTVAGSDLGGGFGGDGGLATSAMLFYPNGIALDAAGNLYIVDTNNHRVRKVNTSGIISTIAGTGAPGFSGDGGPATSAQFNLPIGIAVGPDGSLFITIPENNNCRVRKIAPSGIINTFAGTATCSYAGDGGAATTASLNAPLGVAVDGSGNVFIAEMNNHRIRRVGTDGVISTVAGFTNGYGFGGDGGAATAARLASPIAVAVDGSGKIYIADKDNNRIRVISSAGIINTLAGPNNAGFGGDGGLATLARLNYPTDVKADNKGNFFVAELGNSRIRKVDSDGLISTVAGSALFGFSGDGGPATDARLNGLYGVLPDGNGNLLIADTYNNRIRKVNAAGVISTIVGTSSGFSGDGGQATSAQLKIPYALALDNSGLLYIADTDNNRIRRIGSDGVITTVVGTGTPGFSGDGGAATSAQINFPTGIAFDAANNLYIADNRNQRIRRVTPGGTISTIAGNGSLGFGGDNGLATAAQLLYPFGISASTSGVVFFSDNGNARVRRIGTDGIITTLAGTYSRGFSGDEGSSNAAQLNSPFGLGVDGLGNLLIADGLNARIRKVACVNPPVVSVALSSSVVCVGDAITLTASCTNPNVSYSWSGTSPIASTSLGSALTYPVRGNMRWS